MADPKALDLFKSVRRRLAEARHFDTARRDSETQRVRDAATAGYVHAVDALVVDLGQLEDLGALDALQAHLADDPSPQRH